jgi:cupin superfamily acireductone dioxygenase involved in methionine salvage
VNIVRSNNPVQIQFKHDEMKGVDKYHTHTEINKKNKSFFPHYTYVYYIQMPDVMDGEDGVLYFKGENEKEYWIRPEEDDLIIIPGHLPHSVGLASKSNKDRIVLAGNVGFEMVNGFDTIKQIKTLL